MSKPATTNIILSIQIMRLYQNPITPAPMAIIPKTAVIRTQITSKKVTSIISSCGEKIIIYGIINAAIANFAE